MTFYCWWRRNFLRESTTLSNITIRCSL